MGLCVFLKGASGDKYLSTQLGDVCVSAQLPSHVKQTDQDSTTTLGLEVRLFVSGFYSVCVCSVLCIMN